MQKLCGYSGLLPSNFVIKGLTDTTLEPVARGGCADIYQAKLRNEVVALKSIRVLGKPDDVVKVTKVGISLKYLAYSQLLFINAVDYSMLRLARAGILP